MQTGPLALPHWRYTVLHPKCRRWPFVMLRIFLQCHFPYNVKSQHLAFFQNCKPSPISRISLGNSDGESVDDDQCATMLNEVFYSVFTQADHGYFPHSDSISFSNMCSIEFNTIGISQIIDNLKLFSRVVDELNSRVPEPTN